MGDAIEVRAAAAPRHLSSVRAVAADLAMREDFDLDEVADLRLAVDEACSILVQLAVPASTLVCRFTAGSGEVRVQASVTSADGHAPAPTTFSWRVLDTLADSARSEVHPDGASYLVRIELVKRKSRR
ncbi:MAG: ATP-binding protein [Sciscionella sp.]